jgi:lipopolysaccharide transport system ATP-binding protein
MKPAIRVEGLSKKYRIGTRRRPHATNFREALTEGVKNLFHRRPTTPKETGEFWALKDVSFEVQPGEVVGIIGRNGAGKSTLLKILSRIVEPTTGRVEVRGRMGSLLEVGTGFHPELTGRENIYLNGSVLGMTRKEIDSKFDEIVAFSEIEQFLETPVKRYSSGMYIRLAFAVAAHLEPEILVVDEVLAVGDAEFQKKSIGKMGNVARDGKTVIIVSHNANVMSSLCNRAFLLRGGLLASSGETSEILREYVSDATHSENGYFSTENHPARHANHKRLIKTMVLKSRTGQPTAHFYTGDALRVELKIENDEPIVDPRIAVSVEDSLGRRLFTVASFFSTKLPTMMPGSHGIECIIPRLRLGGGRYLLSTSISSSSNMLDSLDNAAWFNVESKNIYGNGEVYIPVYGPIVEDSLWVTPNNTD